MAGKRREGKERGGTEEEDGKGRKKGRKNGKRKGGRERRVGKGGSSPLCHYKSRRLSVI